MIVEKGKGLRVTTRDCFHILIKESVIYSELHFTLS